MPVIYPKGELHVTVNRDTGKIEVHREMEIGGKCTYTTGESTVDVSGCRVSIPVEFIVRGSVGKPTEIIVRE